MRKRNMGREEFEKYLSNTSVYTTVTNAANTAYTRKGAGHESLVDLLAANTAVVVDTDPDMSIFERKTTFAQLKGQNEDKYAFYIAKLYNAYEKGHKI